MPILLIYSLWELTIATWLSGLTSQTTFHVMFPILFISSNKSNVIKIKEETCTKVALLLSKQLCIFSNPLNLVLIWKFIKIRVIKTYHSKFSKSFWSKRASTSSLHLCWCSGWAARLYSVHDNPPAVVSCPSNTNVSTSALISSLDNPTPSSS